MLFTPTAKYLALAKGLAKQIRWRVYIKKTTSISEAIGDGTWVEVTDRVNIEDLPSQAAKLEYEVGQFTSDNIELTLLDIAWWKANVFNATALQYIECKVQFELGDCTDVVYTFCGFMDKLGRGSTERTDRTTVSVYTTQDLGSRIAAENISTQYVDTNADGSSNSGLILQDIRGMYVMDANISSYVLKVGIHTITYDYNAGTEQAKLDDGRWVALSNGSNTLGNAEEAADDTERITVYVPQVGDLPTTAAPDTISEKVIVITAGTTLPKQWYKFAGTRYLLNNILGKIGITDNTFDTLEMNVAPSPAPGVAKISFIDNPPNDEAVNGEKWAIANNGTDLFIAVAHKVYKRIMSSETYTLLTTLTAGDKVTKLIFNARNNHLWIFYGSAGNGKLRRFDFTGDTLSSEVVLSATTDITWHYSIDVIDFNYTGSSYLYGVVFTDATISSPDEGYLKFVNGSSLAVSTIFKGSDYGFTTENIASHLLFIRNSGEVWFMGATSGGGQNILLKAHVSGAGAWVNDGTILTGLDPYNVAAFNSGEDRIYYWEPILRDVKSHTISSSSSTTNLTNMPSNATVEAMFSIGSLVYFSVRSLDPFLFRRFNYFYAYTANETHDFQDYEEASNNAYNRYCTFTYLGGRLYGVDISGRLFQYSTVLRFYVQTADFEASKVTDSLYKVLKAFNLVGTINSYKKGKVYRRGDASGTPQNSGSSISLTINEAGDITEENADYGAKCDWVEVSNGNVTWSFDGTTYNSKVLSDARTLTITNELIPDEIVQDVCYYAYQFFKTDRVLYTFLLGIIPLFQYEPFDGATVDFTSTKIQTTGSGIIYGTNCMKDGSMEVQVLI